MEDLQEIAVAYFEKAAPNIRADAKKFFEDMDDDKNGKIGLPEYLSFMKKNDHKQMANRHFFNALNKNGSGELSWEEVLTLYYIIESGRPFCGGCDELNKGIFFTCVECFDDAKETFNLCPSCFQQDTFIHNHNNFLDNYALLEIKRLKALNEKQAPPTINRATTFTYNEHNRNYTPTPAYNISNEIVLYNNPSNKKKRLSNIASGLAAGGAKLSALVSGSGCSIM